MNYPSLLAFLSFAVVSSFLYSQESDLSKGISINERPSWVQRTTFALPEKQNNDHFFDYLLFEDQMNVDLGQEFFHYVKHLKTFNAVQEQSTVSAEFDPLYESVILHEVALWRNKEKIDKTLTARFEVIQQESNIVNSEYNGKRTLLVFLDDVQVDDIIEFSYTKQGKNPILQDKYDDFFFLQNAGFIQKGFYRVIAGNDRQLHFHTKNASFLNINKQETSQTTTEWSWGISNVSPEKYDSDTPAWYSESPYVHVTEYSNWQEVADWGSTLFQKEEKPSEQMQELVSRLENDPDDKILGAIRYVQNEIRYLGFELGVNSYKPREPNEVLKLRYGDCKDKTLLLMTLLDLMGVRSKPVLVSSQLKGHLDEWHPSLRLFNHVILQVENGNHLFWVDPTCSNQGGDLIRPACYPYGKGLLLDPSSTSLSEMPEDKAKSQILATTTFDYSDGGTSLILENMTIYTGLEADKIRNNIKGVSLTKLSENYLSYYSKRYGKIKELGSIEVKDDLVKNTLTIKSKHQIEDAFEVKPNENQQSFTFTSDDISDYFFYSIDETRKSPLQLSHPFNLKHKIIFIDQEDAENWNVTPYEDKIETDELSYFTKVNKSKNYLFISHHLKTKKDHVLVDHLSDFATTLNKIQARTDLTITLPLAAFTSAAFTSTEEKGFNFTFLLINAFVVFTSLLYFLRKNRDSYKDKILNPVPDQLNF